MLCLKVIREGQQSRIVGAENARYIQVAVNAAPGKSDEVHMIAYSEIKETPEFTVGMQWLADSPELVLGESVTIEVVESDNPDPGRELNKQGLRKSGKKVELYCSWCGKNKEDVQRMISGPNVYICNECVDLCNDILREENGKS